MPCNFDVILPVSKSCGKMNLIKNRRHDTNNMKGKLCFFILIICLFFTACSNNTEPKKNIPYTAGNGSTCNITLDTKGIQEQIFKLEKGQILKFTPSEIHESTDLKLVNDNSDILYESKSKDFQLNEEGNFSIAADNDGTYTLILDVTETGGKLSVTIE